MIIADFEENFRDEITKVEGRLRGAWDRLFAADLFSADQWVKEQLFAVEIHVLEGDRRDLMIFIGLVIIDPLVGVAARGILGSLHITADSHTALHLLHRSQNMKKLIDRPLLGLRDHGIELDERRANESGGGGEIPRQSHGIQPSAEIGKIGVGREPSGGFTGADSPIH